MVIPSITRRAFMKGIAALAGKAAMPKTVSKAMEAVTPSSVNVDSAPWIQNMVGSLKSIVDNRKLESLLPNGAEVRYVKAPIVIVEKRPAKIDLNKCSFFIL